MAPWWLAPREATKSTHPDTNQQTRRHGEHHKTSKIIRGAPKTEIEKLSHRGANRTLSIDKTSVTFGKRLNNMRRLNPMHKEKITPSREYCILKPHHNEETSQTWWWVARHHAQIGGTTQCEKRVLGNTVT